MNTPMSQDKQRQTEHYEIKRADLLKPYITNIQTAHGIRLVGISHLEQINFLNQFLHLIKQPCLGYDNLLHSNNSSRLVTVSERFKAIQQYYASLTIGG